MSHIKKNLFYFILTILITSCGFHLRGFDGEYKLPYKHIYVICNGVNICNDFSQTIIRENLSTIVHSKESADAIISFSDQISNKTADSYSSVGRISSFNLSYSTDVTILKPTTMQVINAFNASANTSMHYNDGLILSMEQEETSIRTQLRQRVANQIITKIIHINKNAN